MIICSLCKNRCIKTQKSNNYICCLKMRNLRKNAMNLRMPGKMNGIARAKEIYGVFWIDVDAIYLSGNQLSLFT